MLIFVVLRILLNPFLNLYQKQLTAKKVSPLFMVLVTNILLSIAFFWKIADLKFLSLGNDFLFAIILAGSLDAVGNIFLVKSLKVTELSIFGPISAYKSVVALILGIFLIKEFPTLPGLIGVLVIIIGSYLLNYTKQNKGLDPLRILFKDRGVQYRFLHLFMSGLGALYIKKAIVLSDPVTTLSLWSILGAITMLIIIVFLQRPNEIKKEIYSVKAHSQLYLIIFVLFAGMQLFTNLTFQNLLVGYSLALFQMSAIINIFLGHKFFGEKNIMNKLIGTIIMIIGSALILGSS